MKGRRRKVGETGWKGNEPHYPRSRRNAVYYNRFCYRVRVDIRVPFARSRIRIALGQEDHWSCAVNRAAILLAAFLFASCGIGMTPVMAEGKPADWHETERIASILSDAGDTADLPRGLSHCVAYEESRFSPVAVSRVVMVIVHAVLCKSIGGISSTSPTATHPTRNHLTGAILKTMPKSDANILHTLSTVLADRCILECWRIIGARRMWLR